MDEKLEIAAASQYPAHMFPVAECCHKREGFMAGAKWQREQSPWISVEEKLPAKREDVLFVVESEGYSNSCFAGFYQDDYFVSRHWRFALNSPSENKVTHWMPIPPQ